MTRCRQRCSDLTHRGLPLLHELLLRWHTKISLSWMQWPLPHLRLQWDLHNFFVFFVSDFGDPNQVGLDIFFREAPCSWIPAFVGSEDKMAEFEAQSLANIAWTWATLQVATDPLISAVARHALHQRLIRPLPLTNLIWSLATLRSRWPLEAFATRVIAQSSEYNPQQIANTLWGTAKMSHQHQALLDCLLKCSAKRLGQFDAQKLANIA